MTEHAPIIKTISQAQRIVRTASYEEKRQAVVDATLANWHELDAGAYGFTGYEKLNKIINKATDAELIDVAQYIIDRREDNKK